MINHISKEDATKLFQSASIHRQGGAKIKNIVIANEQQPKKLDLTKIIAATKEGKGSK